MTARGTLTFLAGKSSAPIYRPSIGGAEARLDLSGDYEGRTVQILDGRGLPEIFSLDQQGFRLVHHESAVTDIYDVDERTGVYEAECCQLVTEATGATRAHVFDHTLRSGDRRRREAKRSREPTTVIHNDYTPRSGPQRVRDLMGEEAEALLRRAFAIVNVWRPIRTVQSFPLTLCDARTVEPEALVPAERRAKDRIGEIFVARFAPTQRWVYFPNMTPDEVVLIKTYDSREDGRSRWCIHTAVDIEGTGSGAQPRESIETRVFAFFGD